MSRGDGTVSRSDAETDDYQYDGWPWSCQQCNSPVYTDTVYCDACRDEIEKALTRNNTASFSWRPVGIVASRIRSRSSRARVFKRLVLTVIVLGLGAGIGGLAYIGLLGPMIEMLIRAVPFS